MKRVLVLPLLLLTSALCAAPGLTEVIGNLPPDKTTTLRRDQVSQLLAVAAQQRWNIFDLLDETALFLKARNKRARIDGGDLRAVAPQFNLGGKRVNAFLPLDFVVSVQAGARLGSDSEVEVRLSRPFSAFLELGDFDLQMVYGFRELKDKELGGAFGVTVRKAPFRWNMQKVVRITDPAGGGSPHFIAIHLDGFFKPKRWKIDPITTVAPTTKPKAYS